MPKITTGGPIEAKVYGATIGAAAGTVVANVLLWLVGVLLFGGPHDATGNGAAIAAVPDAVAAAVRLLGTAGTAFVGGYLARHTVRAVDRDPETGRFLPR